VHVCTHPFAHCVPLVHATHPPLSQTGVVPMHVAWSTHESPTHFCGTFVDPILHCVPLPVHATHMPVLPLGAQMPVGDAHVLPHMPQLPFIDSSTQTLLQMAYVETLQLCVHVSDVVSHFPVPPVGAMAVQLRHDAPQWLSSSATQLLPQRWYGDAHVQLELTQCSLVAHLLLQPLQLLSSIVVSTHDDPQSICDPEHPETQP
jgi:hypothetical protein